MIRAVGLMVIMVSPACLFHSLFVAPDPGQMSQDECMSLFDDISDVQAERQRQMEKMSDTTRAYKSERMSKGRYHHRRISWLETERRLRTHVTKLYDIGYTRGCF